MKREEALGLPAIFSMGNFSSSLSGGGINNEFIG